MSRSLSQHTADANQAQETTTVSTVAGATITDPQSEGEGEPRSQCDDCECASEADKRFWWLVSGAAGALAMASASFGAHDLKRFVSDVYYLDVWNTAVHYHLTHSIVLAAAPVVVAAMRRHRQRTGLTAGQQMRQSLGLRTGAGDEATAAMRRSKRPSSEVRLRPYRNWSATLIASGSVIFCGSLYALVLTEKGRPWGLIAPVGAISMIGGWACLAVGL